MDRLFYLDASEQVTKANNLLEQYQSQGRMVCRIPLMPPPLLLCYKSTEKKSELRLNLNLNLRG